MTERSKIAVETVYGNYTSLTLVEKNVVGLDNSFYFQILVIQGGNKKLTARVETSEIIETTARYNPKRYRRRRQSCHN